MYFTTKSIKSNKRDFHKQGGLNTLLPGYIFGCLSSFEYQAYDHGLICITRLIYLHLKSTSTDN